MIRIRKRALIGVSLGVFLAMCILACTSERKAPNPEDGMEPQRAGVQTSLPRESHSPNVSSMTLPRGPRVYPRDLIGPPESLPGSEPPPVALMGSGISETRATPFIGNRSNKRYYSANCSGYAAVPKADRVLFQSARDAENAGFKRHPKCAVYRH
jgi:hypothetical protein